MHFLQLQQLHLGQSRRVIEKAGVHSSPISVCGSAAMFGDPFLFVQACNRISPGVLSAFMPISGFLNQGVGIPEGNKKRQSHSQFSDTQNSGLPSQPTCCCSLFRVLIAPLCILFRFYSCSISPVART